jgi:hypothetical protein
LNARLRLVVFASGLFLARPSAAQDAEPTPPSDPAPSAPAAPSDSGESPPPAPTTPPPAPSEPSPPSADSPSPAPSGEAPPPLLAPLPSDSPPATATFPADSPPPPAKPKPAVAAAAAVGPTEAKPASTSSDAESKKDAADDAKSESRNGLLGPFRIGPIIGTGTPSILSLAGEIRLTRYFGAGVRVGLIPTVRFSYYGDATVSYQDYGAYAHVHPFGGGFLLGAELGYALVKADYTGTINTSKYAALGAPPSVSTVSDGSVETLVLTPEIGYVFTWPAGFTFGFDAGAQIPAASSHVKLQSHVVAAGIPSSLLDPYLAPDQEKVRQTLVKVGQTVLPAFHLRIGWLL